MEDDQRYCRDAEDELSWASVDQMHAAVLQLSKSCFEFKKLCVVLLGAAVAVMLKLTNNGLDDSLFVVGLCICIAFWLADATNYYYQREVRRLIDRAMNKIGEKNCGPGFVQKEQMEVSIVSSLFNLSMTLYYSLVALLAIGWLVFRFDWITA